MKVTHQGVSEFIGFNYKCEKCPYYSTNTIFYFIKFDDNTVQTIKIPENFKSDARSDKLSIFWCFIGCPHNPKQFPACFIHDWIVENPEVVNYNRKLSSKIFESVLLSDRVNPLLAKIMYFSVEFWQWCVNFRKKRWK